MIVVQITDTHLTCRGTKAYGIAPMNENLSLCVDHINQLNPAPDVVLVTGDISYSGKIQQLEVARSLLNQLNMPYFVIPGNHDNRLNILSVFNKKNCPVADYKQDFIHYVIDDYELRLIALDSIDEGKPGGKFCEKRADWLDTQLSQNIDTPTLIFMHHPPLKLGVLETDEDGFVGKQKLASIIRKYSQIEQIICGHIHLPTFTRWNGTIVSTAPSTGMQLLLDLSMELPSQFLLAPPAYQLHHWTNQKRLITHTITVTTNTKSYPFEEQ